MDFKQIQELIKLITKSNLTEFKVEDGDFKLSIRTEKFAGARKNVAQASAPQILPVQTPIQSIPQTFVQQAAPVAPEPAPAPKKEKEEEVDDEANYIYVKSPIVGTFYRSPSPDKDAFVKVGDSITPKTVVCIVEAMKLFNEIESEVTGKIVKVLVDDASPVEYDQALFLVDPKG